MASFENTLDRMKALYTYGKDMNESKKINSYTLEHSAVAADGRTYGIIKECNKYYIKLAQPGKELMAESYQHLGGFCNKGDYEYTSYNNALKNFELKMASINEAYEGNVNISTLDPFKKGDFIIEGTERMKDIIARQRQIMYNASMLMNESSPIGASRKNDTVMYDGQNPESETGKQGDEGYTKTSAKPEYAGSKTNGVDKKVGPFNNEPKKGKNQVAEGCDCGSENCSCDWGSAGIGKGKDPKKIGWEIDGQTIVNESEDDWASQGLPSTPGVGEADTDHNNAPFNKTVNESEEDDFEMDVESDDVNDEDLDVSDFDTEDDMVDDEEDIDFEMGDEEGDDFDMADDEEYDFDMDDEEGADFEMGDDDIMSRIAELEAELESLKTQINGEETEEFIDSEDDEFDVENDMDTENDFETEFDNVDDSEFDDEMEETPDTTEGEDDVMMESKKRYMNNIVESVVKKFINEDELHVFGKHPGYRKKPMELPTTGQDKNQWGEDWNDASVYSEEPFGSKIGSSAPFEKLVDTVTKDVMTRLSGDAFKKKVK